MRDLAARALDWLLTRKQDRDAIERARREADMSKALAAADLDLIRDAHDVAARLAQHRRRNHFAERMYAAFREERP